MKTKFVVAFFFEAQGGRYEIHEFTVIEHLDKVVKDKPVKLSIQITGRRDILYSNQEQIDFATSSIGIVPLSNANNNVIGVLLLKNTSNDFLPI